MGVILWRRKIWQLTFTLPYFQAWHSRTKLQLTEWTKPEKVLSISSSSSWSWSWTYHNFFFRPIEPVMDEVVVAPKKFSKKKKWQLLKMDKLIGRRPKKQDRNISRLASHWNWKSLGWLNNDYLICRPQRTLTFWVNHTFLDSYQHNLMSNDLTKIEPRLFSGLFD